MLFFGVDSVPGSRSTVDREALLYEDEGVSLKGPRDIRRMAQQEEAGSPSKPAFVSTSPVVAHRSERDHLSGATTSTTNGDDLKQRSFVQQFFSLPCMVSLYFATIHVFRINFYVVGHTHVLAVCMCACVCVRVCVRVCVCVFVRALLCVSPHSRFACLGVVGVDSRAAPSAWRVSCWRCTDPRAR